MGRRLGAASRQLLLLLLYKRLQPIKSELPAIIHSRLKKTYLGCLAVNIRRFEELNRVCVDLNQAEIQFILFKGAHLAEIVYGDAGLRPMSDWDIPFRRIARRSRAKSGLILPSTPKDIVKELINWLTA